MTEADLRGLSGPDLAVDHLLHLPALLLERLDHLVETAVVLGLQRRPEDVGVLEGSIDGGVGDGDELQTLVADALQLGGHDLTHQLAEAIGAALQRPAAVRVPPFAVKMALGEDAAGVLLSGQRATPRRLVDAGFAFVFPDLESALADLLS